MKRILVLLFLVVSYVGVNAQDVKFTASAPRVVEVGETFRLVYSLNKKGEGIELGEFNGFQILMGPSVSNSVSTQYINGKVSTNREQSFSYVLSADKVGKYLIKAASIRVDGKPVHSNVLEIEVVKSQGTNSEKGNVKRSSNLSNENLFLKIELDKKSIFMGDYVIATLKLFSRVNVSNIGRSKFPSFQGFLSQEIDMPGQISLNRENVNGEIYSVGVLRKLVLFPQHSGKINIDPFELDIYVRQKSASSGSVFDDFFANYEDVKVSRSSKPISVLVKPLPAKGQPFDFSGSVGDFKLKSLISRDTVYANDAVTLKINISGNGNLKLIEPLDVNFPADFEIYEPKTSKKIKSSVRGTSGSVTFEYVFIPRSEGKYIIPSVDFSFFNSKLKRYKTLKTKEFVVQVKKNKVSNNSGDIIESFSKEDVKLIGKDIRFIKTRSTKLYEKGIFIFGSVSYYISFVLLLLIFMLIVFLNKRRIRNNADIVRVKNKRASKLAKKRLKTAELKMKSGEKEVFYDEILKALWGFTSDKLNMPISSLSKENIAEVLNNRKIDENLISEYLEIIDTCEFARYAPSQGEKELGKVYDKVSELLTKLG